MNSQPRCWNFRGKVRAERFRNQCERLIYLKLIEKHQNTDPFKFIIYSAKIGEQTPQMAAPK